MNILFIVYFLILLCILYSFNIKINTKYFWVKLFTKLSNIFILKYVESIQRPTNKKHSTNKASKRYTNMPGKQFT
jgi:hypothetical protein